MVRGQGSGSYVIRVNERLVCVLGQILAIDPDIETGRHLDFGPRPALFGDANRGVSRQQLEELCIGLAGADHFSDLGADCRSPKGRARRPSGGGFGWWTLGQRLGGLHHWGRSGAGRYSPRARRAPFFLPFVGDVLGDLYVAGRDPNRNRRRCADLFPAVFVATTSIVASSGKSTDDRRRLVDDRCRAGPHAGSGDFMSGVGGRDILTEYPDQDTARDLDPRPGRIT